MNSEIEPVYEEYHNSVNMSYSELKTWSQNPCSKKASLSREPITRNLRLLKKRKSQWTRRDAEDAKRTISFIARHKNQPSGPEVPGCGISRRTIALMNWAYNPNKN